MINEFSRTESIYGKEAMKKLKESHVAIFGIGGVGGYVAEALARSGVGSFTLIDHDTVTITNLNRQIIATHDTIGKYKVDVMKDRILSINPNAKVEVKRCFYSDENKDEFSFDKYDYIIDAIDSVKSKISLVLHANLCKKPIISSMGAGNKVNPMGFVVTDIYKTEMDPLAKVMRSELRKLGIKKLKVIYSKEKPLKPIKGEDEEITNKREIPGSNAFVPSAAGLLIASVVVRDLTDEVAREELKRHE